MNNPLKLVSQALETVITRPGHDESALLQFFSPEYQQCVDGKILNYQQFVSHLQRLKHHSRQMKLQIIASAESSQNVFTRHQVIVTQANGQVSEFEVMAHFELRDDRIYRCHELTRQTAGPQESRDLGSC
ncbi:nuclear transport factor 2 family protein [Tatumella citrea]|uniref:SnoaL-like domain-containing protein n=1 Tax=Tatumella citrea TaxID=53336 RepID=A0A1Y0LHY2_TATCI|nr:nuclear transport factor 2 family protein [Tatumella citrea]ARU93337.1 hypothetical protein A7K98_05760 [Tatumella citrea]ARU97375.1 hypothetical protein A7K99_05760 [Tatumella citrea]